MTFGIVIASYKYGHLAAHCIETILAQTRPFDKIWFVDDGIWDCKHIEEMYGDRLDFHENLTNLGIVENFNNALNRVDTDYVMFIGADNWLRSDALELLVDSFKEDFTPDIVTYDIMVTGELKYEIYIPYQLDMLPTWGDFYWNRRGRHHGSMLYRVDLAKQVGGYENNKTSTRTDEDMNLWDKMVKANAKIKSVNKALLYYRRHKENFNKY